MTDSVQTSTVDDDKITPEILKIAGVVVNRSSYRPPAFLRRLTG